MASICNVSSLFKKVFPVGVYYGKKKPADCKEYLKWFVEETVSLTANGIAIKGEKILVSTKDFVCNAPAKSLIFGVKRHTGVSPCTRCKKTGV
jgi:hypothetical protein